jgi:fructokinase
MARFLVAGEALVDITHDEGHDAPLPRPGGSPLNVAVGLARLGHDVLLATRLGADSYGELTRAHVEASGVRLTDSSVSPDWRTSSATVTFAADRSASYEFDLEWDLASIGLPDGIDAVHVGSLGTWLEPGASAVHDLVRAARERGLLVSYDPNARPALVDDREAYVSAVLSWAKEADVVKASREDVDFIVGADGAVPWHSALDVVTAGSDGVWASAEGRTTTHPSPPVRVVDTIGAGDSFMAGLLDGLARFDLLSRRALAGKADVVLDVVIPQALVAAAITCSRAGADPPTRGELDAALAPHEQARPAGR